MRFLAPIAAALGLRPEFVRRGRLAERPFKRYDTLEPGLHTLPGDVSSQFVTGLLFALPILKGDSQIRFSSSLESRGYVDMTLQVLRDAGVTVNEVSGGFDVPGNQHYIPQTTEVEGDWSGAAFWYAMNALGSDITVTNLNPASTQPDRAIIDLIAQITSTPQPLNSSTTPPLHSSTPQPLNSSTPQPLNLSQCPDIFPVLTVVAAATPGITRFTGIRRLRIKECDRVAAMADVLTRFGREVEVSEDSFVVKGSGLPFRANEFTAYGDHRIAMSVAVGATKTEGPVAIDDVECAAKSYPGFFWEFARLQQGGGVLPGQ